MPGPWLLKTQFEARAPYNEWIYNETVLVEKGYAVVWKETSRQLLLKLGYNEIIPVNSDPVGYEIYLRKGGPPIDGIGGDWDGDSTVDLPSTVEPPAVLRQPRR